MAAQFNVHEAKTHLSRLLQRVEDGEEIVIARAGRPAAKLVPYRKGAGRRKRGGWKGKVVIHGNFDDPLPEDILITPDGGAD